MCMSCGRYDPYFGNRTKKEFPNKKDRFDPFFNNVERNFIEKKTNKWRDKQFRIWKKSNSPEAFNFWLANKINKDLP